VGETITVKGARFYNGLDLLRGRIIIYMTKKDILLWINISSGKEP